MEIIMKLFLNGILTVATELFIISKITDQKVELNLKKISLSIVLAILISWSFTMSDSLLRLILVLLISIYIFHIICKLDILEASISTIFSMILITISEVVFISLTCFLFNQSLADIQAVWIGNPISNFSIYGISLVIINIPIIKKVLKKIVHWNEKRKNLTTFVILVMVTITVWIISYINVTKQFDTVTYIMTIFLVLCLAILVITVFNERITNENNMVMYEQLKEYIDTYEILLEDLRESQHENKNKLMTIRGMVNEKNTRLMKFIDNELDTVPKIRHSWVVKLKNITDGGLKSLLYSKIMLMEEFKINFFLDISKTIKNNDEIESLSIEHYKNLCTIVGVYLDNAIEAAKETIKPQVMIEIFCLNNKLQLAITNNYKGKIRREDIDNPGETSKGGQHGYGLSLVKKIIDNNNLYKQHREITDEHYIQTFELNLKAKKERYT